MSYLPSKLPEFSPAVVETKRTFSPDLNGLCDWLETQNPETEYPWYDVCDCLGSRFLKAVYGHNSRFRNPATPFGPFLPDNNPHPNYYAVAYAGPRTYGAALSRARAALESQP